MNGIPRKIVSLQVNNVNTIFRENDRSTGFVFITIATSGTRHYRITRDVALTSLTTKSSDHYDFLLTLDDYPQGQLVMLEIPYRDSDFREQSLIELPRSQLASTEVFKGMIFKLLHVSGYANDGHTLDERILRAEVPSLIDFTKTYVIGNPVKHIRFIYYRLIDGLPYYTGFLGNQVIDGQYLEEVEIDKTKTINEIILTGITYYIIQITATPNVIVAQGIAIDKVVSEDYTDDSGLRYKLTAPSRKVLSGKAFYVYLAIYKANGESLRILDFASRLYSTSDVVKLGQLRAHGTDGSVRILLEFLRSMKSVEFQIFLDTTGLTL